MLQRKQMIFRFRIVLFLLPLFCGGVSAASLAGLSTIGEANENYWQLRLMGEYVMPASSRYRSICAIGVEYLAPYGPSSRFGGFYLVVSLGILL